MAKPKRKKREYIVWDGWAIILPPDDVKQFGPDLIMATCSHAHYAVYSFKEDAEKFARRKFRKRPEGYIIRRVVVRVIKD